jgi:serine protease Do
MSIPAADLSTTLTTVVENVGKSVVRVEGAGRRSFSGIAWSPTNVITSARPIQRDEFSVFVEDQEFKARVVGYDVGTDLALVSVDGALTPATFSDAPAKVGQLVLMLARPGLTVRATSGIISAVGHKPWRSQRGGEVERYLEADAPHQPGFSGGPLVSLEGAVLGMTSTALVRGTSLTVPTVTVRRVVEQLLTHGKLRKSWLGLSMQPVALPDEVQAVTGEELGLLVVQVAAGGPAEQAGIKYGDTLLHLGDDSVKTLEDLHSYLAGDHVGQAVPAKLFRGGKVEQLQVTLGVRP